jgi:hypothetical protein
MWDPFLRIVSALFTRKGNNRCSKDVEVKS